MCIVFRNPGYDQSMGMAGVKYGAGREALIRAAIDVVAEGGLDAFSYRKVAQRARVAAKRPSWRRPPSGPSNDPGTSPTWP